MRDGTVKRLSRWHRRLFRLSRGRVGRRLVGNDMLLLTTSGNRTGRPHTVPLLFLVDQGRLVVIASYGGRPNHPIWYDNLVKTSEVRVETYKKSFRALARTADAEERARLWPMIVAAYPGYAEYQGRTNRLIPVVLLEPIS